MNLLRGMTKGAVFGIPLGLFCFFGRDTILLLGKAGLGWLVGLLFLIYGGLALIAFVGLENNERSFLDRRHISQSQSLRVLERLYERLEARSLKEWDFTRQELSRLLGPVFSTESMEKPVRLALYLPVSGAWRLAAEKGDWPQVATDKIQPFQDLLEDWIELRKFGSLARKGPAKSYLEVLSVSKCCQLLANTALMAADPHLEKSLHKIRTMFQGLTASLCFPCVFDRRVLGLIFLGVREHQSWVFRQEEIRFLRTFASNVAILRSGAETAKDLFRLGQLALMGSFLGPMLTAMSKPLEKIREAVASYSAELSGISVQGTQVLQNVLHYTELIHKMMEHIMQFHTIRKPQVEEISLETILSQALSLLDYQITRANINIVRQPVMDLPLVQGDAMLLNIACSNIIRNAVQAMGPGGTLTLAMEVEPESIVLSFRDSGSGIPTHRMKRIFDRHYSTKGPAGLGLGLSISRDIVEAHGGQLEVRSLLGAGCTFMLRLPRVQTGRILDRTAA